MKEAIGFYVVGCTAFYTSMEKTLDPYFPDYSITDSGILFSLKYGKRREIKRHMAIFWKSKVLKDQAVL